MQAKARIGLHATSFLTDTGYFLAGTGYWRAAMIAVAAAFLLTLLTTQLGKVARMGKSAELAVSRARQLLHDAERENRNIRPVPLSLAMRLGQTSSR
jgi:hypothetical protein